MYLLSSLPILVLSVSFEKGRFISYPAVGGNATSGRQPPLKTVEERYHLGRFSSRSLLSVAHELLTGC